MMTQWQQASLEGLANCDDSLGIDPLFVHVPKNYIDPNAASCNKKTNITTKSTTFGIIDFHILIAGCFFSYDGVLVLCASAEPQASECYGTCQLSNCVSH